MDPQLQELLRTTRNAPGEKSQHSFVTYYGPSMNFTIKPNKLTDFWQGYCQTITRDDENYGFGEKLPTHCPVTARFTLKFQNSDSSGEEKKIYPLSFLLCLVQCMQQAIIDTLEVTYTSGENCEQLICAVQESDQPRIETTPSGDFLIMQLQLQFPYCKDDLSHQRTTLRYKIIEHFRKINIMNHLSHAPVGDWDTIMEVLGDSIPLYRSTTRSEIPKLTLNYIFGPVPADVTNIPALTLSDVFHYMRHIHVESGEIKASLFNGEYDLDHWTPLFLSMNYCRQVTPHREIQAILRPRERPQESPGGRPFSGDISEENDIQKAERFLHMMRDNPLRVTEENYWRDIGKALHRCSKGGEDGLQAWIGFTERHDRDPDECRMLYYTPEFQNSRLTIRTLAWFAREDAPMLAGQDNPHITEYTEWHRLWCIPWMSKATSCRHAHVGEAFYRVYWLSHINSTATNSGWYAFRNHVWNPDVQGNILQGYLIKEFANMFSRLSRECRKRYEESEDANDRDREQNQAKKYEEVVGKLGMLPYQKSILGQCCQMFYTEDFNKYLDTNPCTIGMSNCVIEVCNGHSYVRPGKPEDYIKMSTHLRYPEPKENMSYTHPSYLKLNQWLSQVFVDSSLKHHFLKICASLLRGRNAEKRFHVWTGSGNNSKSMIVKLLQIAFGSYCVDFPMALLTGKAGSSSGPNPELAQSRGAHIAVLAEPDEEEKMKGGTIKRYTGGDRFFARMCNENGGSIEAMFKTILMCNDIPPIPSGGQAVRNRLSALPFLSKWVENPPETEEEQKKQRRFLLDPFFEDNIPSLAPAFMFLLVQYYPIYIREGIIDPQIVKDTTEQYWRENDPYQNFHEEMVVEAKIRGATGEESIDMGASLTFTDLFGAFKSYYRDHYPGAPMPNSTQAKSHFEKRMGLQRNRRWFGVRLSNPLTLQVVPQ